MSIVVEQLSNKDLKKILVKLRSQAASQDKYFDICMAERSEGLKQMFIRWHKEGIEELEQVKSLAE